jgi:hypothetical protein
MHSKKAYGEVKLYFCPLTLTLDGDEWLAWRPGHFTFGEKSPITHE